MHVNTMCGVRMADATDINDLNDVNEEIKMQ